MRHIAQTTIAILTAGLMSGVSSRPVRDESVLHLRGSDTVAFVMRRVAEAYMVLHPEVSVFVSGGGTWRGYKSVIDGTADVGMISAPLPEDLAEELSQGAVELSFRPLAVDAVVPIVHRDNPLTDLTVTSLRDIFSGQTRAWNELGGAGEAITIVSREGHSGSFELWRDTVLTASRALAPASTQLTSTDGVMRLVASTPAAIGYATFVNLNDTVKALRVNGVEATRESIAQGKYPLWRRIGIVTRAKPSSAIFAFLAFATARDAGLKLAEEARWILPEGAGKPEPIH